MSKTVKLQKHHRKAIKDKLVSNEAPMTDAEALAFLNALFGQTAPDTEAVAEAAE